MSARTPLPEPFDTRPFSYGEARRADVTPGRLRGSDLARPFHGTRIPRAVPDTTETRCLAFQRVMRADAFSCSVTAAIIMHVPLPLSLQRGQSLHVAVPNPTRAPEGKGISGHKVRLMGGDAREWNGIRISSPERVWCELSTALSPLTAVAARRRARRFLRAGRFLRAACAPAPTRSVRTATTAGACAAPPRRAFRRS
ncbi:MAG: hypothetical protein JWM51_1911 [Microbacteriaceae bacterium]|nr:hypothetical protein [Microbacteriaceae bacterium]